MDLWWCCDEGKREENQRSGERWREEEEPYLRRRGGSGLRRRGGGFGSGSGSGERLGFRLPLAIEGLELCLSIEREGEWRAGREKGYVAYFFKFEIHMLRRFLLNNRRKCQSYVGYLTETDVTLRRLY